MLRNLVVIGMITSLAVIALARLGLLNPSYDELKQSYTDSRSRFISVKNVPIHIVEEGQGPAIILLHGYLASLKQWDGWAAELRKDYRVIRFDIPPFGLSGPDPTNIYSVDRAYILFSALAEKLEYKEFAIAGTSNGSILALRYAADHPERVSKLLLSTVPAYNPTDRRKPDWQFRGLNWFSDTFLKVWRPKVYWRMFLENLFGDPELITEHIVTEYADLNNRVGAIAYAKQFVISNAKSDFDVAETAGRVSVPTLIQWAGRSPVLSMAGLKNVAGMFTNTSLEIIRYPELGHKLMIESPHETVVDAMIFLKK
jgi:pimeloyl-ACP methyl ester carboxylesterase